MNKKTSMKIHLSRFILALFLFTLIVPLRAMAAGKLWDSNTIPSSRQKPRLLDEADLLTDSEEAALLSKLDETSQKWSCNIALLTVDDHDGDIQAYADDYFDYNGFGTDYNGSGILFMLSMYDREWAFSTSGSAINAFTDYGQAYLVNAMIDDLRDGDYNGAFTAYVRECDKLLEEASKGTPYDVNSKPIRTASDYVSYGLYSVLIGLLLALAPILKMKSDLKTVKMKAGAGGYQAGSPTLSVCEDRFLNKTLHRTPISHDNNSSGRGSSFGGGSSVHTSSSGHSHGGSHGHF